MKSIPLPREIEMLKEAKIEQYQLGKSLRKKCPRESHQTVNKKLRPDPVSIHSEKAKGRIANLLPVYIERMLESPFAYYRAAAAVMASDLSQQQDTGIRIQICGDCHLLNFGGFATPERRIIFDINDFDETGIAPWEWDVKRLASSFAIAGRWKKFPKKKCYETALEVVSSYQAHMAEYAKMSALEVWYSHIDYEVLIHSGSDEDMKRFHMKRLEKAMENTPHEKEFNELTAVIDGKIRIVDAPPLLFHLPAESQDKFLAQAESAFANYLETLDNDRRMLLGQYKICDVAMKVVGVGSVGTRCGVMLLLSDSGDPLFLQFKEAGESVLPIYEGSSRFETNGQRVVEGQKIMQSASDIFLGWTTDNAGTDYYIRQLRDAKIKPVLEVMDFKNFCAYASVCGWALAQAHARSGNPAVISGYIGRGTTFKKAIASFAMEYEKVNRADYKKMKAAMLED